MFCEDDQKTKHSSKENQPEKRRLTKRTPFIIPVPTGPARTVVFDDGLRGVCIVLTPAGSRTFYLYRKIAGRPQRVRIGSYPRRGSGACGEVRRGDRRGTGPKCRVANQATPRPERPDVRRGPRSCRGEPLEATLPDVEANGEPVRLLLESLDEPPAFNGPKVTCPP